MTASSNIIDKNVPAEFDSLCEFSKQDDKSKRQTKLIAVIILSICNCLIFPLTGRLVHISCLNFKFLTLKLE